MHSEEYPSRTWVKNLILPVVYKQNLYKVRDKTGAYRSKHYYNSDKNKNLSDLLIKAVTIPELVSTSVSASSTDDN